MGAGGSAQYASVQEALADGVSHADLLAHGVSQADLDFLTWNEDEGANRHRSARPCEGSKVGSHKRR